MSVEERTDGVTGRSTALAGRRIAVSDGAGALGRRVDRLLRGLGAEVIDLHSAVAGSDGTSADTVVWLSAHEAGRSAVWRGGDPHDLTAVLATIATAHLVVVSSAMVYGAWANNPVPLTEDTALRPDVEHACRFVAVEQCADDWRRAGSARSVTVLRPAVTMAVDAVSGLAAALASGAGQRPGEHDPPAQFLHLDDLASAIVLAVERRLDGVFNVAPDGAIPGDRLRALAGGVPRIRLPARLAEVATSLRWRFQRGPIPPGLVSYARCPWLVANDRLVGAGWRPTITNEQAYVEGTEAKWWTMVSPKRRQELALGGAGVVIAVVVAAVVTAVRRSGLRVRAGVPPGRP